MKTRLAMAISRQNNPVYTGLGRVKSNEAEQSSTSGYLLGTNFYVLKKTK